MKKKFIIVFVILAIIVIIYLVRSFEENEQFPQNEDFVLEIISDPTMKTGDKIPIDAELSNNGEHDYIIEYTRLFILSIDGRKYNQNDADTIKDQSSFSDTLSPGETISESFDFIPDDIGVHEIMIETVFEVRLPSDQTKEYRYQTKLELNVTD
jgi:hypothetical protein